MTTVFAMMAKAPIEGQVKTRLCPPLTEAEACSAATAFLLDTWSAVVAAADDADGVALLARVGALEHFPAELRGALHFPQQGHDLGARIDHVASDGLRRARAVVIVGSDMPGLPALQLLDAARALADHDAVLGPSPDGGYYLIGFSRHQAGLLAQLPWSQPDTFSRTRARLRERGYRVAEVAPFDDVDDGDDLLRLEQAIASGALTAPRTAAWLRGRAAGR